MSIPVELTKPHPEFSEKTGRAEMHPGYTEKTCTRCGAPFIVATPMADVFSECGAPDCGKRKV